MPSLDLALTKARCLSNRSAIASWPFSAARCRAALPCCRQTYRIKFTAAWADQSYRLFCITWWMACGTSSKTSTRALLFSRTLTTSKWPCSLAASRADHPFYTRGNHDNIYELNIYFVVHNSNRNHGIQCLGNVYSTLAGLLRAAWSWGPGKRFITSISTSTLPVLPQ